MVKKQPITYRELHTELETILAWFESDAFDIDAAAKQYDRASELIAQLEATLLNLKNHVQTHELGQ